MPEALHCQGQDRACPRLLGGSSRYLVAFTLLFLVGSSILVMLVSRNRAFQVDEVEHVHVGYHIRDGKLIYRDFPEFHNPLIYLLIAPVIDVDDAVGSFLRSRWPILIVLMGNVALAAYCAWRLAGVYAALLAAGLLLVHSTFVERGIEIRPDGPMSLCVTLALALELTSIPDRRRFSLQALALSAAFLFTNKAVFACFAFGCLWLVSAIKNRRPSQVLWPLALWCVPQAAMLGWLGVVGSLKDYLDSIIFAQIRVATRTAGWQQTFSPVPSILQEGIRNLLFISAGVVGIIYAIRSRAKSPKLAFTAFLAIVLIGSLWANPFPFPYLHVTVLPTVAILAAVFLVDAAQQIAQGIAWRERAIIGAILVLAAATSLPRLLEKAQPGTAYQLDMLETIQNVTDSGDSVFDMVGLYFRQDAYPVFVMTGNIVARYRAGGFPAIHETLRENEVVAVMINYRTAWLPETDTNFLRDHFVHFDGNVLLLGTDVTGLSPGTSRQFDVLKEERFRYEGDGTLLVDGQPFAEGVLSKDVHILSTPGDIDSGRLILSTPGRTPNPPRSPQQLFVNFD